MAPGVPKAPNRVRFLHALRDRWEERDENAQVRALDAADKEKWDGIKQTTGKKPHYYWIPDTKVIGAIDFGGTKVHGSTSAHGTGTTSVSAGNGQENAFLVPNTTLCSSQEGPDWIVTVGAVSPGAHASYTGHGKPADIAGIGSRYPAAYGSPTVGGTGSGGFGGTSNATPTIAGTYARALYLARRDLAGPSRVQTGGVIARGSRFDCGSMRPDCELGDGVLTAVELRERLFHGALHTEAGLTPAGVGSISPVGEDEFIFEGHGSYFARETGKIKEWLAEFERILGPLEGRAKTLTRPEGEREWMIVDSFCRQHLWGSWSGGYYRDGKTEFPGNDPNWPLRSAIETTCPHLQHTP